MATPNSSAPLPTGKGRASRIPLDYYKSLNKLEKTKLVLTVVALLGTGLWLAWGAFAQPKGGQQRFSHGPVAAVHARWDNDCQACHVSFAPISEQNLFFQHPSSADKKCVDCHDQYKLVANDHYRKIEPASNELVSCGGCHHDHRGRDFSLVHLADSDCTSCHKDLKSRFTTGENIVFANAVASFATHPEFGAYTKGPKDPGALKFNHKLHLQPGQVATNGLGGHTLGKIRADDEDAYIRFKDAPWQKDKADNAPVQMDCASCHVPNPGEAGVAKSGGRYMQPIKYDNNCKVCHPLTFDAAVKDKMDPNKPLALPHGRPLGEIDSLLRVAYNGFKGTPLPPPSRPLPGKRLSSPGSEARSEEDLVKEASRYLKESKAGCIECHFIANNAIVPVQVPEVWFKHARFSHTAHEKTASCADCHGMAKDSTVQTDVLLPDIKNCRTCHAPEGTADGKRVGGVRHDCTTCHSFHHGDGARP